MPIVEATGLAVPKRTPKGARVERAMREALEVAAAEGEVDPQELKRRMLEARDSVRA